MRENNENGKKMIKTKRKLKKKKKKKSPVKKHKLFKK